MPTYRGNPAIKDGIPPLTTAQEERLEEWIKNLKLKLGLVVWGYIDLKWSLKDETRPGRGHDLEAIAHNEDHMAWISLDVYGNGNEGYSVLLPVHNSASETCPCDDCVLERLENADGDEEDGED